MARKAKELSDLEVRRLKAAGMHAVGGVSGLYLQIKPPSRTWILRATVGERRRDMGLGGYPDVPLAQAREKAREARFKIDQGIDPIEARREAKSAMRATAAAARTFAECATGFMDAKSAEWRNAKHRQQWVNTLKTYADPVIGKLLVRDVTLAHVLKILEPIWATKTETAARVRGRIETVLDWATVRGYREGDNPARWRGHLDKLLAAPSRVQKVEHHTAVAVGDMAGFMAVLRAQKGLGAKALEFAILTAARSGEVRGATWSEIDLLAATWTVPSERMKAGKAHRVPLSPAVVQLLESLPRMAGSDVVFPSSKGRPLSDMTLSAVLRRLGLDAVPHGFRSTFKDWASERTTYPPEMSEMALAHTIDNKVEAAYRRGDMFEKRRQMMKDWADFCGGAHKSGAVTPIRARKRA